MSRLLIGNVASSLDVKASIALLAWRTGLGHVDMNGKHFGYGQGVVLVTAFRTIDIRL